MTLVGIPARVFLCVGSLSRNHKNVITEYNDLKQGLNQSTVNKPFTVLALTLQRSTKDDLKRAPGHRTADPGRSPAGGQRVDPFIFVCPGYQKFVPAG
jgi:hypothetical protein